MLKSYQPGWLRCDLLAGLSVAAVAVPIGIAYAPLAGLPPVAGLYASILPLVAYALFGSSRQLIVGPDAATTAIVGSALAIFTAGGARQMMDASMVLAILTGLFCVIGGIARLGFLANFLARPILTGYLNGTALSIIAGQLGSLFGYSIGRQGFFRTVYEFISKLDQTNLVTLAVGLSAFTVLRLLKHRAPSLPGPLIAVIIGITAAYWLGLSRYGVTEVGPVPAGLPPFRIPEVTAAQLYGLMLSAAGITLVTYSSGITTARGFASKNHYDLNPNQEFAAMGFANIASGLSQGFIVCGADSRTAISDTIGGKTQLTGVFAAVTIAAVLLFATGPIAYLPVPVLGAIMISAAVGLFSIDTLKMFHRANPVEFWHSLLTTLGVITIGLLPAILVAIALAIILLLSAASHPHDAILGRVKGLDTYYDVEEVPEAETQPGIVIYRFDAALVFFNADHFRNSVRAAVAQAEPKPRWFLFDAEPMNAIDTTGAGIVDEIITELKIQGVTFAVARIKRQPKSVLDGCGITGRIGPEMFFPTVREGVRAFDESGATGI